jgi:hypothetical protein
MSPAALIPSIARVNTSSAQEAGMDGGQRNLVYVVTPLDPKEPEDMFTQTDILMPVMFLKLLQLRAMQTIRCVQVELE